MRSHELEVWVRDVVDRVRSRLPVEDNRVELKKEWIDEAPRAARRLAAHANVAHGESILWLVGVDEKAATIPGANAAELSVWWAQVQAQFDLVHPGLEQHMVVPIERGVAIVSLLFDTRQAPYQVRNPAHGARPDAVSWEVPWRDGTGTRTARRSELLRILSPRQLLPDVEMMEAFLGVRERAARLGARGDSRRVMEWDLSAGAYFAPHGDRAVVIPFHRCQARATFEGADMAVAFDFVELGPEMEWPPLPSFTFGASTFGSAGPERPPEPRPRASEWVLRSPTRLLVTGLIVQDPVDLPSERGELVVLLGVVGSEQDLILRWQLEPDRAEKYTQVWVGRSGRAAASAPT